MVLFEFAASSLCSAVLCVQYFLDFDLYLYHSFVAHLVEQYVIKPGSGAKNMHAEEVAIKLVMIPLIVVQNVLMMRTALKFRAIQDVTEPATILLVLIVIMIALRMEQ